MVPIHKLLAAMGGISMILCLSFLPSKIGRLGEIQKFGRLSLEIFVIHTLASAGCRVFLDKVVRIEFLYFHLVLGMVVGLYFPIIVKAITDRINFKYLFTYP